jgi:hypothetical protein
VTRAVSEGSYIFLVDEFGGVGVDDDVYEREVEDYGGRTGKDKNQNLDAVS